MGLAEEAPSMGFGDRSVGPVCGPDPFGVLAAAVAGVRDHVDGLRSAGSGGLGGLGLGDAVVALVGLRAQVESVELVALEGYRQSMDWSVDGYRSVHSWLGDRCRLPRGAVGRRVGLGRKLESMPATAAAFAAGSISFDHVDRLCRANKPDRADEFVRAEGLLVANARRLAFADFAKTVARFEELTNPEPEPDPTMEGRKAHSSRLMDGMGRVDAWLDAVGWTTFGGVLRRIEKELFQADWATAKAEHGPKVTLDQLPRTPQQRRADAVVEMAARAAAAPAGGKRPLPVVVIHMDSKTFERGIETEFGIDDTDGNGTADDDMMCELADGTPITPAMAIKAALQGHVQRAVYDSPDVILNYGRTTRFATGTLRDVIKTRDRTCTGPGCHVAADNYEIDHIIEWQHHGQTSTDNLNLKCGWHHRWKHLYTITKHPTDGAPIWRLKTQPPQQK